MDFNENENGEIGALPSREPVDDLPPTETLGTVLNPAERTVPGKPEDNPILEDEWREAAPVESFEHTAVPVQRQPEDREPRGTVSDRAETSIAREQERADMAERFPERVERPEDENRKYDDEDGHTYWRDPVYESAAKEELYTPGKFAYGTQPIHQKPPRQKRKVDVKKHTKLIKAMCLVLVCAIVSGTVSWAVASYMLTHGSSSGTGRSVQVHIGNSGSGPLTSVTYDENSEADGADGTLSAKQIYNHAINQMVGVDTSLTSTNYLGQTVDYPVSGSGFIISEDGYILTNYHVISYAVLYGGTLSVLMYDGSKYDAQIIGFVDDNDVAVIKIDAEGLEPVTFGDSDSMSVGEQIYAVGNPLGELTYTMTDGIVSALDRVITTSDDITSQTRSINMFQISAAVNSGNSGGPVYNDRGEVIGIVTAKSAMSNAEGLGFAIPINDAVTIAAQLIEKGYVSGAVLSVTAMDTNAAYTDFIREYYGYPDGACIISVDEGGAADKAGFQPGDIITGIDDVAITSTKELKLALRHYSPGDKAVVHIYRTNQGLGEGENMDLSVILDEEAQETETDTEQDSAEQENSSSDWWDGN